MSNKSVKENGSTNVQKIDAIREIIFGQSVDDIYDKINALEKLVSKQNTQIRSTILKLDEKLNSTLKELRSEQVKLDASVKKKMESELTGMSSKMKSDVSSLSKRIILQREKLDKNIRKNERDFHAQKKLIENSRQSIVDNENQKLAKLLRSLAEDLEK